jgi:hypothetical protein
VAKLTDLVEARRFDIYDEPDADIGGPSIYASNTAGSDF